MNLEAFKAVFASLGDVEFAEFNADGDLVITTEKLSGLLQDGSEEGAIVVSAINLVQDAIVLDVEAGDTELQETLEAFQDALEEAIGSQELIDDLGTVLDSENPEEAAVLDSVDELQETLAGGGEPTPEQVEDLMDNFEELDEETQIEFLETIGDAINDIDPDLLGDFGDLFGDFDQSEEE